MKATQQDFAAVAPRAARQARIALLLRPRRGRRRRRRRQRIAAHAARSRRAGRAVGRGAARDPVRLGDEARSTSLFGGARHIVVRANGDEAHDAVENLLEVIDAGEARRLPGADRRHRRDRQVAHRQAARRARRCAGGDVLSARPRARCATQCARWPTPPGSGSAATWPSGSPAPPGSTCAWRSRKSTKLALYLDASPQAPRRRRRGGARRDRRARPRRTASCRWSTPCSSGDASRLPGELRRMRELSLNPVGLLLAFERRAAQLAQLAARLGPGGRRATLLEAEQKARGGCSASDGRDLAAQLSAGAGRKLERLVERLVALHRALLANSQAASCCWRRGWPRSPARPWLGNRASLILPSRRTCPSAAAQSLAECADCDHGKRGSS